MKDQSDDPSHHERTFLPPGPKQRHVPKFPIVLVDEAWVVFRQQVLYVSDRVGELFRCVLPPVLCCWANGDVAFLFRATGSTSLSLLGVAWWLEAAGSCECGGLAGLPRNIWQRGLLGEGVGTEVQPPVSSHPPPPLPGPPQAFSSFNSTSMLVRHTLE